MTATAATASISAADADAVMERLHRFVYWTDDCISIPGLDRRVGLDPLIGLIPVWGDAVGALISCYVPYEAYRVGAPPQLILKMLAVIVAEAFVGAVPLIGDLIDAVVKSNRINVQLLEDYLSAA